MTDKCDWILEIDAGYSHQPSDIPLFFETMKKGYDCVFGSRFCTPTAIVITSIASPNHALRQIAGQCLTRGINFIVIGDTPSASGFHIDGCDYSRIARQKAAGFKLAEACPERHYALKNIGYLIAIKNGSEIIIETDDNLPYDDFWQKRSRKRLCKVVDDGGWININRHFTDQVIWPRGLPLNFINSTVLPFRRLRNINEIIAIPLP